MLMYMHLCRHRMCMYHSARFKHMQVKLHFPGLSKEELLQLPIVE